MNTHQVRGIRIHEMDNVAVVVCPEGGRAGELTDMQVTLAELVPMGHKFALTDIARGEAVVRYGEVIGYANASLRAGQRVHGQSLDLPDPPALDDLPIATRRPGPPVPLEGYTFDGYRNADGSVGTKNLLCIATSVQCVAGVADHVARRIRAELLPRYPNVDDVVALNHAYGCGVAIDAPEADIPIRTLRNILRNPNFGGEVLMVGLGCEKLQPGRLLGQENGDSPEIPACSGSRDANVLSLQDARFRGFEGMVDGILEMAERRLARLDRRRREPCPLSALVVGMQCGGSDALSGITANPVAGYAADLIVRAGGSVLFSEVTEVRDAIHLLTPRAASQAVGKALIAEMRWFDDYLARGQVDRSANPSPGNKGGGLSNVVEKALGSIAKSGTSEIVEVLPPGERISRRGLVYAATPASDFICGTLQIASGMNVHVFTTGRGTPYGLSPVPVIKVATNSTLAERWHDLIDFDAGRVVSGDVGIEQAGWELFELILETASGRHTVAADKLGLHNDMVLFNPAPVT